MLRYASVPYLNARPLLEGLEAEVGPVRLEVPSVLTRLLSDGEVDVALAPVVVAFDLPGTAIVPGAAIAARGPVESVLLFARVPPAACRVVGLDTSSRTSADLLRVLYRHLWRASPRFVPIEPDAGPSAAGADAVLLIGDPALRAHWEGPPPIDLAEAWVRWTGLPFVFAAWIARTSELAAMAEGPLARAAARGAAALDTIAERGARELGISPVRARRYLLENLRFELGPQERAGIERFRALRAEAAGQAD